MGYTPCLGNSLELTPIIQRWFCVPTPTSPIRQSLAMQSRLALYSFLLFAFIYFGHRGGASCGLCVHSSVHTSLCVCVQACMQGDNSLLSQCSFWGSAQVVRLVCKCLYPGLEFLVFSLHIPSVGIIMHVPSLKVPLSA